MRSKCFRNKLLVIVAACAMIVPCMGTGAKEYVVAESDYGMLIYDDFEVDNAGFLPRGEETVELSTEEAYSGLQSLKISGRTKTWNGPMCDKTEYLTLGETYTFSVMIKYSGDSYSGTKNFSLQLQYNDGTNDQYKNIKTASVTKGTWTKLTGEYTIPTDATDVYLYVETEYKSTATQDDLMDFYIDDFTATPASLPQIQTDIASLQDVFSNYFIMGGAATASEIAPKPAKELFVKHYNSITFGNELKPDSVLDYNATITYMSENGQDETNPQISLRAAKTLLEFARDNNMPVRGHTLVWHAQTPDWFFKVGYSKDSSAEWVTKEVMLKRLENYIKNVMSALAEQYPTVNFYAWDVVNEAVDPNTSTGYRNPGSNNVTSGYSAWMQTIGSDFIEKAFEYARKYAPTGCKLFYNDYNEYETTKMNYIYNILVNLKAKGLVDGIGMQSHWIMEYPSISMFETAVKKYDSLDLEIQLTEVDMKNTDNSTSGLEKQATRYKQWFDKMVELKNTGCNITAVVFWGITDATSWLGGYPLLFDGDYQAKPAYYSIVKDYVGVTPTATPTATPTVTPTTTPSTLQVTANVTTKVSGNTIHTNYTISANQSIDISKLKIVFTADNLPTEQQVFYCDHAALQLSVDPWYVALTSNVSGSVSNGTITIAFDKSTVLSANSGSLVIDTRVTKTDWSNYSDLVNTKCSIYYDGNIVE